MSGDEFHQTVYSDYCFSLATCPSYPSAPSIGEDVLFRQVGGRWLIGGIPAPAKVAGDRPAPWERGDLVFAQGRRVTVAAAPGVARYLTTVVAVADQAAAVDDRFADMLGNPPQRYRIYLAGPSEWGRWFGGEKDRYAVGYEHSLNEAQSEVVLKIDLIRPADLRLTLQHEMGHVVTLAGVDDAFTDDWETEGIACMADRYSEPRMIDFVKLTLRQSQSFDEASRAAFGRSFDSVNTTCVDWIRRQR